MDVSGPSERRIVSVLFADLAGSTSVAEQLDPEDWAEVASAALTGMGEAVSTYGGTIGRLMGDGILAIFGAPVASEDDPERAVRAGLGMIGLGDRLRAIAGGFGARLSVDDLGVRVGIATGPVLAGPVGSPGSSEYTVLGDTANLAARLEKLAPSGGVLIAGETYRSVADLFEFDDLQLDVRGKDAPVEGHLVRGVRAPGAPRPVVVIGRETERRVLADAVETVVAGRGVIVGLIGEAGMGKSILLDELASSGRAPVYRVAAVSYETSSGLALARRVVTALGGPALMAEVLASEPDARRMSLAPAVDALAGGRAETTTDAVATAISTVLAELVRRHGHLVLIVDDVHWADDASAEVVSALYEATERMPIGVVWATRPMRRGTGWRLRQLAEAEYPHRYVEVRLAPIDHVESSDLVRGILGPDVDPEVVAAVAERAGGNPYFAREIATEVAGDPATVAGRLRRVPVSLQRLLLARFDRLGPAARTVLEVAAVVGAGFDAAVVGEVVQDDVASALHELAREGVVEQETGSLHRFGHSLVREAAYESISKRRRRELHRSVGLVLEAADADPSRLFFHFREAGELDLAARCALEAGERAVRVGAYADARRIYDDVLDVLDPAHPSRPALLIGRGRVRDLLGDTDGGLADLDEARQQSTQDPVLAWQAAIYLGEAWAARDYRRTGEWFRRALEIARAEGTPEMVATSLNRLGNWYANASDPSTGIELHTEALRVFRDAGSREGEAATLDLLGMANLIGGDERAAHTHFVAALERFDALGDVRGKVGALIASSIAAPNFEVVDAAPFVDADSALEGLDSAVDMADAIGWLAGVVFALFMRSQVRACTGRLGEGIADAVEAVRIARQIGHGQWLLAALLYLGAAEAAALDFDSARRHIDEAQALVDSVGSVNWALQVAAISAEVAVRAGDVGRADRVVGDALALPGAERFASSRSCRAVQAFVRAEQGRGEEALALLGSAGDGAPFVALVRGTALRDADPGAAVEALREGVDTAERSGMSTLGWRLYLALAEVTGDEGDRSAARAAFCHVARSLDHERGAAMRAAGATRYGLGCEEDRHGLV